MFVHALFEDLDILASAQHYIILEISLKRKFRKFRGKNPSQDFVTLRLTMGRSRYRAPHSLESLALDILVAVESQPEVSRLRRDLRGKIRAAEVAEEIRVTVLTVTYLEEIECAVRAVFELELVPKVELQQHTFLS